MGLEIKGKTKEELSSVSVPPLGLLEVCGPAGPRPPDAPLLCVSSAGPVLCGLVLQQGHAEGPSSASLFMLIKQKMCLCNLKRLRTVVTEVSFQGALNRTLSASPAWRCC